MAAALRPPFARTSHHGRAFVNVAWRKPLGPGN